MYKWVFTEKEHKLEKNIIYINDYDKIYVNSAKNLLDKIILFNRTNNHFYHFQKILWKKMRNIKNIDNFVIIPIFELLEKALGNIWRW